MSRLVCVKQETKIERMNTFKRRCIIVGRLASFWPLDSVHKGRTGRRCRRRDLEMRKDSRKGEEETLKLELVKAWIMVVKQT